MDGEGREAIASHHDRVFPDDLGTGSNLVHGDHPRRDRAPDLQTVEHRDVLALAQGWAGDDRQEPRLLRIDSRAGAAWLTVEADHASFKATFQGLGHLNARDAIAACLEIEQVGADDFRTLAPVAAHERRPTIVLENLLHLVGEFAQFLGIGTLEPHLNATARTRAQEEFLRKGVGVWVLLVQMSLDVSYQPVDFPPVIDIDEKLYEGSVLPFRTVDEHEAQTTAADERRDMGDAGLNLDELPDIAGERLRFADMSAGRQEDVHHELRPGRGREEALLDHGEAVE